VYAFAGECIFMLAYAYTGGSFEVKDTKYI
jgi:hypothetical protein